MKPVAPIDHKSISAPSTMTSAKSRSNNNKNEDKSPGGTSNADHKSYTDSPFSDGELLSPINEDIKPNVERPLDMMDQTNNTNNRVDVPLTDLSGLDTGYLLAELAKRSGFTLNRNNPHSDDTRSAQQPSSRNTYNDSNHYHMHDATTWHTGMFDGRETPMTTGFLPDNTNFSQRNKPLAPTYLQHQVCSIQASFPRTLT